MDSSADLRDSGGMSADDARHTTATVPASDESRMTDVSGPIAPPERDVVAARVPAEYREAYLEGFARGRADRDDVHGVVGSADTASDTAA